MNNPILEAALLVDCAIDYGDHRGSRRMQTRECDAQTTQTWPRSQSTYQTLVSIRSPFQIPMVLPRVRISGVFFLVHDSAFYSSMRLAVDLNIFSSIAGPVGTKEKRVSESQVYRTSKSIDLSPPSHDVLTFSMVISGRPALFELQVEHSHRQSSRGHLIFVWDISSFP